MDPKLTQAGSKFRSAASPRPILDGEFAAQLRGHRNASTRSARRDVAVTFEQHVLQKITASGFLA
jgi:hypothetical protein